MGINLTPTSVSASGILIADTGLFYGTPTAANANAGIQLNADALPPGFTQVVPAGDFYSQPVSAALEINSTSGGLLLPRLTDVEINRLISTDGMMVYNKTNPALMVQIAGAFVPITQGNGNVIGPDPAVVNNVAVFGNVTGTVLLDSGVPILNVLVAPFPGTLEIPGYAITNLTYVSFANVGVFAIGGTGGLVPLVMTDSGSSLTQSIFVSGLPPDASSSVNATLEVQTDEGALLFSRLTSSNQAAFTTSVPGMGAWNSSVHQFQIYTGTAPNAGQWVNLTTTTGGGPVLSITAGTNVTLGGTAQEVIINASGGGGGGGVTEVDTGTGLTGGPITTTGTISLAGFGPGANTYLYPTSVQVDATGRVEAIVQGSQPITALADGTGIQITGSTPSLTVGLAAFGPGAGAYAYPASVSVDVTGRVQTITTGSQPITSITPVSGQLIVDGGAPTPTIGLANFTTAQTVDWPSSVTTDITGRVTLGVASAPVLSITAGTNVTLGGTAQEVIINASGGGGGGGVTEVDTGTGLTGGPITTTGTISLAGFGPGAGAYAYPASVSVDATGRVEAITTGSQPITSITPVSGQLIVDGGAPTPTIGLANFTTAQTVDWPSSVTTDITGRVTLGAASAPVLGLSQGTDIVITETSPQNFEIAYSGGGGISTINVTSPITGGGSGATVDIGFANSGVTAMTYAFPTNVAFDVFGRATSATAGVSPVFGPTPTHVNAIATWSNTGGTALLDNSGTTIVSGTLTTTGAFIGGAGLVTAPTFTFSTDNQSGLYSIATGTIGIAAGGILALAVTSNASAHNYVQITAVNGIAPIISAAGAGTNLELQLSGKGSSYVSILPIGGNPAILGLYNAAQSAALRLSVDTTIATGYTLSLPAAGGSVDQVLAVSSVSGGDVTLSFVDSSVAEDFSLTEVAGGAINLSPSPLALGINSTIDLVNLNGSTNTYYFSQVQIDQYGRTVASGSLSLGSYSNVAGDGPENLSVGINNIDFTGVTDSDTVDRNVLVGIGCMQTAPIGTTVSNFYNTAIGADALAQFYGGSKNTAVGFSALLTLGARGIYATAEYDENVAVGSNALQNAYQSLQNTAIGTDTFFTLNLVNNSTLAKLNTAVGFQAGYRYDPADTGSGTGNTIVGSLAGQWLGTGTNNTYVGIEAGVTNGNTTARNDSITCVGAFASSDPSLTNAGAFGANSGIAVSNGIALGGVYTMSADYSCNIGIGTASPVYALDINPVQGIQGAIHLANGGTGIVAPPANDFVIYNTVGTPTVQFSGSTNTLLSFGGTAGGNAMVPNSPIITVSAQGILTVVSGGEMLKVTEPSTGAFPYTVLGTDCIIGVTDTSVARTVVLRTPSVSANQVYVVKDESGAAATNNITISVSGGSNIDGAATAVINTNYGSLSFYCNGTQWYIY